MLRSGRRFNPAQSMFLHQIPRNGQRSATGIDLRYSGETRLSSFITISSTLSVPTNRTHL